MAQFIHKTTKEIIRGGYEDEPYASSADWVCNRTHPELFEQLKSVPPEIPQEILLSTLIDKIKSETENKIKTLTFEHDNKTFSCDLIAQLNYIGLKTAIDCGFVTYPKSCWAVDGTEFVIVNESDLNTLMSKLFSKVYPVRAEANTKEKNARAMTKEELKAELNKI